MHMPKVKFALHREVSFSFQAAKEGLATKGIIEIGQFCYVLFEN